MDDTPAQSRLPGSPPFAPALLKQFAARREERRGTDYTPRTRHLRPDGWATYTNRLFLESSPYLLQHAHNPVNWYPWSDEAFAMAKRLGRPVLLSIGYSTCHWCHVMEEESFEDVAIARYLNEHYIAIKVDREERPDVDAIYMSAVQAMTGSGGWPLNVWLTPERKPFFGGTYFPPRDGDRGAHTGFMTVLQHIHAAYHAEPEKIVASSNQLAAVISDNLSAAVPGSALPSASVLHNVVRGITRHFDATHGGLNTAPKFPSQTPIRLLLRYYRRTGDPQVLTIVTTTLNNMAAGGIYDQVGGGFHRYATDAHWLVPHFEKMLYDNALLVMAYLEAFQVTGNPEYARVVSETLRYVEREMTAPHGAFYSATDADSLTPSGHRDEGYFFTWTPDELETVLGTDRLRVFGTHFPVTKDGNFEGRTILHTTALGVADEQVRRQLEESKALLYAARRIRPPPLRDEKILAAWNGLMISAHAQAGLLLGDARYIDRAVIAAESIFDTLFVDGRLARSYTDGQVIHHAYLDDYACLTAATLDLYEATHDPQWLERAIAFDRVLAKCYEDPEHGGFFMTSADHEKLLAREKPNYDGAEPSGNSVAILNLYRLSAFTTDDHYRHRADTALIAFSQTLNAHPNALTDMLLAVDFRLDTPKTIVIVTPAGKRHEAEPFLAEFRKHYLPNRALVVAEEGAERPLLQSQIAQHGKTTAYVCEKDLCKTPTTDPAIFAQQIATVEKLSD